MFTARTTIAREASAAASGNSACFGSDRGQLDLAAGQGDELFRRHDRRPRPDRRDPRVELQLAPIRSAKIDTETLAIDDLAASSGCAEESAGQPYTVAWIDCPAKRQRDRDAASSSGRHWPRRRSRSASRDPASACRSMRRPACSTPTRSGRSTRSITGIALRARRASGCTTTRSSFRSMRWPLEPAVRPPRILSAPVRGSAAGALETAQAAELIAEFAEGPPPAAVLKLFGDGRRPACCRSRCRARRWRSTFPTRARDAAPARPHGRHRSAAGGRLYPAKDATMSGAAVPRRLSEPGARSRRSAIRASCPTSGGA